MSINVQDFYYEDRIYSFGDIHRFTLEVSRDDKGCFQINFILVHIEGFLKLISKLVI